MTAPLQGLAKLAVTSADLEDYARTSKQRLRLWLRILKVSRRVEAALRERFRSEFSSTLPRFDVMAALDRAEDGLRMSDLSGVLKVSNGNVTGIVDRLVADGFVERVAVEGDRRAMAVRLTKQGKDTFQDIARVHETWVNDLLQSVDAEEAEALTDQLKRIAETLDDDSGTRS